MLDMIATSAAGLLNFESIPPARNYNAMTLPPMPRFVPLVTVRHPAAAGGPLRARA
jgi:hypothetical protein